MNDRQYLRNLSRIPRLIFHIKRCKGQDERVAGFKDELERRKMEMKIAGHNAPLAKLLKIKLEAQANDDSEKLLSVVNPFYKYLQLTTVAGAKVRAAAEEDATPAALREATAALKKAAAAKETAAKAMADA